MILSNSERTILTVVPSSAHILFHDHGAIGVARCDWNVVRENLAGFAHADGDGFAAIVGDLEGVALVDLDHADRE
jgi:hypothetical protein